MIFPYLLGILNFRKAPVTWILVLLNACMLFLSTHSLFDSQKQIESLLKDSYFLTTTGQVYSSFCMEREGRCGPTMESLVQLARSGYVGKYELLGGFAIRDQNFVSQALDQSFNGDQVAHAYWLKKMNEMQFLKSVHPSYVLGLDARDVSIFKWISYQFVHSGLMHYFGNMVFLLIFGSALEAIIGGLGFLLVYLGSGMMAAASFLLISGVSAVPLVGASGAVSGVMGLYCFMFFNKPIRYLFFLFIPKKGYAGFIYLPGWVALGMWALSDLAGYLSSLNEMGGVAYTAHLGGEATGLLVGLVIYVVRWLSGKTFVSEKYQSPFPIGTRIV